MSFTPMIGMSGIFDLKAPYDQLVTPKALYTLRSIRTINDVLAAGEQPYEAYYKSVGLDKPIYEKDFKANTCIIGIQAGTGEWVYVPQSYIVRAPNANGVKYATLALGISLGAVPDAFNLEGLKAEMTDLVLQHMGIEATVKGMMLAQPCMISQEYHEQLERARLDKKTRTKGSKTIIAELQAKNAMLELRCKELEKWISENRLS